MVRSDLRSSCQLFILRLWLWIHTISYSESVPLHLPPNQYKHAQWHEVGASLAKEKSEIFNKICIIKNQSPDHYGGDWCAHDSLLKTCTWSILKWFRKAFSSFSTPKYQNPCSCVVIEHVGLGWDFIVVSMGINAIQVNDLMAMNSHCWGMSRSVIKRIGLSSEGLKREGGLNYNVIKIGWSPVDLGSCKTSI